MVTKFYKTKFQHFTEFCMRMTTKIKQNVFYDVSVENSAIAYDTKTSCTSN